MEIILQPYDQLDEYGILELRQDVHVAENIDSLKLASPNVLNNSFTMLFNTFGQKEVYNGNPCHITPEVVLDINHGPDKEKSKIAVFAASVGSGIYDKGIFKTVPGESNVYQPWFLFDNSNGDPKIFDNFKNRLQTERKLRQIRWVIDEMKEQYFSLVEAQANSLNIPALTNGAYSAQDIDMYYRFGFYHERLEQKLPYFTAFADQPSYALYRVFTDLGEEFDIEYSFSGASPIKLDSLQVGSSTGPKFDMPTDDLQPFYRMITTPDIEEYYQGKTVEDVFINSVYN